MDTETLRRLVSESVRAALAARAGSCPCGGTCGGKGLGCPPDCPCKAGAPPIEAPATRRLVLLFDGAVHGERDARQLLASWRRRFAVECVVTTSYLERYDPKWLREDAAGAPIHEAPGLDATEALLRRAGVVFCAAPSRTLVAKVAVGIADEPGARLLTEALLASVPVVLGSGDTDPAHWRPGAPGPMRSGPRSLGEAMAEHLLALERWGAHIRRGGEAIALVERFASAAESQPIGLLGAGGSATGGSPRFYTSSDIRLAHREGRVEVRLGARDRVTDEATTVARDLGVRIVGPG